MSSGDSRFAKVFNDPRFMVAPNKVTKVKIDKRFETMFKNKEFNVVAKVDKYGRKINKQDKHALQNYYTSKDDKEGSSGSDSDSSDEEDLEKAREEIKKKLKAAREPLEEDSDAKEGKKFYDETGKFHWSGESSGSSDDEGEGEEDQ